MIKQNQKTTATYRNLGVMGSNLPFFLARSILPFVSVETKEVHRLT